jgi:hypothetical protein
MTTDELLKAVAQAAREDEIEADPRWSALVEGKLSEQDRAALEALASSSPRHDEALRLLTPLDEGARARFADAILAQMQGDEAAAKEGPAPAPPPREGAQVLPFPKRRPWVPAVAALGVAAGVALFIGLRGSPREPRSIVETSYHGPNDMMVGVASENEPLNNSPVPAYEIALLGGEQTTRADPAPADPRSAVLLGPGSSLEILLRPATPEQKPIAVRGFLIRDERARLWEIKPDVSPDGAVRIAGERERLFANMPAGSYEIVIAVGRPGALPNANAVTAGKLDARVRMFRRSIELVDRRP